MNRAALHAPLPLIDVGDHPRELRRTFAQFPSGVAAVSATTHDGPLVFIVSSFQVGISLDPPLVLFAVQRTSGTWPRLRSSHRLGISVLGEAHQNEARQLAAQVTDRFADIATTTTESGAHFVLGSSTWLECSLHAEFPAGDHDVVLLQVHAVANDLDVEPLVWHDSAFRALASRESGP